jgi:hypothetical protein
MLGKIMSWNNCMKFITPKSTKINDEFWFESHFYGMPQETSESIKKLINSINLKKLLYIKEKLFDYNLGFVIADGQEIPVHIGNFEDSRYIPDRKIIRIPYGTLNKDVILQQIEHEVGHLLDKKIKSKTWKGPSKKYIDAINKGELTDSEQLAYDKEPVEFDAIGTSFDNYVKRIFKDVDLGVKQEMIDRFVVWLKLGGEVPYFNQEITERWQTNPTLWRKFQHRVYNLVQELEQLLKG